MAFHVIKFGLTCPSRRSVCNASTHPPLPIELVALVRLITSGRHQDMAITANRRRACVQEPAPSQAASTELCRTTLQFTSCGTDASNSHDCTHLPAPPLEQARSTPLKLNKSGVMPFFADSSSNDKASGQNGPRRSPSKHMQVLKLIKSARSPTPIPVSSSASRCRAGAHCIRDAPLC